MSAQPRCLPSLLALMLCAGGCGGSGQSSVRTVDLAEFSQPAQRTLEDDTHAHDAAVAETSRDPAQAPVAAREPVQLEAAAQPPDADESSPATRRVVVDSLVGQVNGRPIFADAFFAPIEDQLIAIRRRVGDSEFLYQSRGVILEHLQQIVFNELFISEAEAQLTPDQQMGLLAWMRQERELAISRGGGTRAGGGQRIRDQEGMSIDEYVEARRDVALIQQLRRDKIEPRVIVSWRDVQREYQRRYDEFNPPATVTLARIRLSTQRDAETIDHVKQRIAGGEEFATIASDIGQAEGEQWQQFQMDESGLGGIGLSDDIRRHIADLDVGQTSQPFEVGSSTWWLHIAGIERGEGRDLGDPEVQRQIRESLHNRRFTEEMNRYIASLFERGIYDELETMLTRLLDIAAVRYGQ